MIFCADTGFILSIFSNENSTRKVMEEINFGKTRIIIPIIVYSESIKKLFQKGFNYKHIMEFYEEVFSSEKISIASLDLNIAEEAAKLSHSSDLSLTDSIIAATCKLMSCDALLSGDTDYKVLEKKKYLKVTGW